jgi:hypothetical protein
VISRANDAGDNNARPAWLVTAFAKPDRTLWLQVGASLYVDRITIAGRPEVDERIVAGHAVWLREDPEVIAEIAHVRHRDVNGLVSAGNLAYYVQAAYRLPPPAIAFKPYYRFEHIDIDRRDPVFSTIPNLDGSTAGIRFDISTYVAIKTEVRSKRRNEQQPRTNGWFLQISYTF